MRALERGDSFHLSAARGWLELGSPEEASLEFAQISSGNRGHPDVLEVEWELLASGKHWEEARRVGERLVAEAPERHSGWIQRAFALHELGRTVEALAALEPALGKFPLNRTIAYNLACYACRLGRLPEARRYLSRAYQIGGKKNIRELALGDADLELLWGEIKGN